MIVQGEFVWDDRSGLELTATYIWVKGGILEIGTGFKPFMHQATVTLTGYKYDAIRMPVIGAKCLAVSNEEFIWRDRGR